MFCILFVVAVISIKRRSVASSKALQFQQGEVKIQRGIFQGESLSPLMFVICLILLSIVLRSSKIKGKYQLGKDAASLNHLLNMDDLKLYGKDDREADSLVNTLRVINSDIGMEFGLKKCGGPILKKGRL